MGFVQFNLLPDVKLEFNRAQRTKKLVYLTCALVTAIAVGLFVISFLIVNVAQKELLSHAQGDIDSYSKKIKSIPNLDKVLTIQNQLNSLPPLHDKKHVTSRMFTYLPQVTPTNLHIGQITLDLAGGTIDINGTADKVETVNALVDTLKFTNYIIGTDQSTKKPAFSSVVLASVGRTEKGASYEVRAIFDPALFDVTKSTTLIVPNEITTRSVLNSPDINNLLFNGDTGKPAENNGSSSNGQ